MRTDQPTRATDPEYLRYQYADSEKLRIRLETHRRCSERSDDWVDWVLGHLEVERGARVLDVGCGPGLFHPALLERGARVVGLDSSPGMVEEAGQQALGVDLIQADAQRLPLADKSCDRAMANHVLFHVPDQIAALGELRRVVRPGGRVVLSTVGDQNRLLELHAEAARALGLTPESGSGARFTLDHLPLVRSVFPRAERHVRADAFLFRDVGSALRYYASGLADSVRERSSDRAHRAPLLAAVGERIQAILAMEGVFRVPKDAGCFVAMV